MTLAHYSNIVRGHLYRQHNKCSRQARELVGRHRQFLAQQLAQMVHPSRAATYLLVRDGFSPSPVQ